MEWLRRLRVSVYVTVWKFRIRLAIWLARGCDHDLVPTDQLTLARRDLDALEKYVLRSGHMNTKTGGGTRAQQRVLDDVDVLRWRLRSTRRVS